MNSLELSLTLPRHTQLQPITHVARLTEESQGGDTRPCCSLLLKYQGLLEDYLQGERLQDSLPLPPSENEYWKTN
uniref:Uncharacterized protein n=1 Tax=Timema tahoe TaxID=61484 RepID=A0A7R9NZZ8_9NEOP|nr:unnamed protein product [Timema tahoe]